jgi:hypothetical protein
MTNNCDHLIGYDITDYGMSDLVRESDTQECSVYFEYCPDCGCDLTDKG